MDTKNALQNAVRLAGGQVSLATQLGVKQGHVWFWIKRGFPPAERVLAIEAATGISRHELRPDIYPVETHQQAA